MNISESRLAQVLTANGFSATKQRQAVFEVLLASPPIAMRQLISKLNGRVDRVSVYRTVALFEKLGILQRLNSGFKYKLELSDSFNAHHHHLTCIECGKVVDVSAVGLEGIIGSIVRDNGFSLSNHQVEIQGKCADCSKRGELAAA